MVGDLRLPWGELWQQVAVSRTHGAELETPVGCAIKCGACGTALGTPRHLPLTSVSGPSILYDATLG